MQKDLHDLVFTDPTISEDDYEAAIKCLPRMVQRLRDQNKTWSMQLEILDTPDTAQARRISQSLDERIRAVLAENAELKSRMDRMEHEIQSRARRSTIVATEVKSQLGERSDERPALEDQARVSWTPREFEKILELSRVYRRNRRGSEIFDFDSSIMRSYSLSDLSLSNISIISVIALPIQVSEVDEDGKWYKQKDLQIIPEHADYDSEDDDATIRARKDTLEDDSLADELDRAFYPADPPVLRDLPSNESPVRPVLLDQGGKALPPPSMDVVIQRMERDFDRGRGKAKSEPVAPRARPDSPFPKSEWDVMTYKSYAQRLFDAESTVHETTAGTSQSSTGPSTRTKQNESTEVLFICASLYAFDLNVSRLEAGYPYLTYAAGDIFDVLARVGELWLARNQEDDSKGELGWVWEKHFVILEADPRFFEDVEGQAFLEKHSTIWTKANAV
ncbi:hypothetical protein BAUCODRAFT_152676 [Lecanosticta acicola]|uniref:Uncharacterized protein n=1 Tax=Lecanosticta acicola TaxID=111012 RepID=A0AAI8Z813_9PEZI|nr:hypothetical protein BAUCODRAFT_152676 [Lecanosticta acicola]